MKAGRIQVIVGVALIAGGLAVASAIYLRPVGSAWGLTLEKRQDLPWKIFEWALWSVAVGAVSFLYKYTVASVERAAENRNEARAAASAFRDKVVTIYKDFKAIRRELRACSTYPAASGRKVEIARKDFFDLARRYIAAQLEVEALDWMLFLRHDFLDADQARLHDLVATVESYTSRVGRAFRAFDNLPEAAHVIALPADSPLVEFMSWEHGKSEVNGQFFEPMREIRQILQNRIGRADRGDRGDGRVLPKAAGHAQGAADTSGRSKRPPRELPTE